MTVTEREIELTLGTTNAGKLKEFLAMDQDFHLKLNCHLAPPGFDPEETGSTFVENALIKARAAASMTGKLSLADDSGLTVEALDGRPGIYSARYAPGTDADRRTKLLKELADVPAGKRQAAFVCALALVSADGQVLFSQQVEWQGAIAFEEKGEHGFGFDPIFVPEGHTLTAAQLSPAVKNQISHRGVAFQQLLSYLAGQS